MRYLLLTLSLTLAGCMPSSVVKPYSNAAQSAPSTRSIDAIDILLSEPSEPHTKIARISISHWKPGLSDPRLDAAGPKLRAAAHDLGGDAIIVHGQQSANRVITVDAEVIRYTKTP